MAKPDKARDGRLAAALRENLRRRKAQLRKIAGDVAEPAPETGSGEQDSPDRS